MGVAMGEADTEVDFEVTSEGLLSINACAVNPLDYHLYCNAQMADGQRIARVGNGTTTGKSMGFIQQAPAGYAFAGYFDSKGGYWIYAQAGLFLVSDLAKKKSYTDYTIAAVAQDQEWTSFSWLALNSLNRLTQRTAREQLGQTSSSWNRMARHCWSALWNLRTTASR